MGKGKNLKKALKNEKQRSLERARAAQVAAASQADVAGPVRKASGSKQSTPQVSRKQYNPYRNGERVLFIGEGDLSFAVAWAERYPASAKRSIATCFDSLDAAKAKYTKLEQNVEALRTLGVETLFDVDAQQLERCKLLKPLLKQSNQLFDKIVFNFPHVGAGEKDEARNVKLNQVLLLRFLRSAQPFLSASVNTGTKESADSDHESLPSDPDSDDETQQAAADSSGVRGSVLLTLFTCKPYDMWTLPTLTKNGKQLAAALLPFPESRDAAPLQPQYKIIRSFDFDRRDWPGYEHRRTAGQFDKKQSLLDREHSGARTWELQPLVEES